jgi:hypothetical protein
MTANLRLLRELYQEQPHLTDLGDGLAAQLSELERDFTEDRADAVIRNLHGAAVFIRRLAVQRKGGAG